MTIKLYENTTDWYAAESEEEATRLWEKHTGESAADYNVEWREMEPREGFSLCFEDGLEPLSEIGGLPMPRPGWQILTVKSSVEHWTARFNKESYKGFVGSTEF